MGWIKDAILACGAGKTAHTAVGWESSCLWNSLCDFLLGKFTDTPMPGGCHHPEFGQLLDLSRTT